MYYQLNQPIGAKNGHTSKVLIVMRVSSPGEGKQDIRSLDDQDALLRRVSGSNANFPIEFTTIKGSGSGEDLERDEYLQLVKEIESGQYDAVTVEDLARIARRIHAHLICELCVDHGTRLIALNDNLDTAVPGWEDKSIFSSWHHERANRDTSDRIKRTQQNRFLYGGVLSLPIFGYVKAPGAKDDGDLKKDPAAEPIYKEWFRRLDEDNASFADIADWLNASGVSTGPYARSDKWNSRMVGRVSRNPILKGERFRNERESVRINSTGKRKTRKAPPQNRRTRLVSELAFLDPEYRDRVIAKINGRNASYCRKLIDGLDCRSNVPKKRTRYPGQCIFCGECGWMFVFGGHGQTNHLMCDGARHYHCWNGATVDGPLAANKFAEEIQREVDSLKSFEAEVIEQLDDEAHKSNAARTVRLRALSQESAKLEREIANVMKLVREGATGPLLNEELARLEGERRRLALAKSQEEALAVDEIRLPTIEHLKELFRAKFDQLAVESFEFAAELRGLAPRIVVFPYRLVDGGPVVLRATFRLQLAELVPDRPTRELLCASLERTLTVDLFDPPQREQYRRQVVAARGAGETERQIAARLGLTVTAVQRAMALQRLMDKLGVDDAYQPVTSPPEDGKMRRHKHPRYKFAPRPDAGML